MNEVTFGSLNAAINADKLAMLTGKAEKSPTILKFAAIDHVPIRTHKKKRIRKKWAKRYGTTPVKREYEAHGISKISADGEYEFEIKNMYKKGILI